MKELWNRIENWLKENCLEELEGLNKGASDILIKKTENYLSIEFPEDVKEFYKIHNGTKWDFGLIGGWELLSLEKVQEQWELWQDFARYNPKSTKTKKNKTHEAVRNEFWNKKWIPITSDGEISNHCIDFAPTEKGNVGQIIKIGDFEYTLVGNSFSEWIENYIKDLEKGKYVYSEDYEAILGSDKF